MLFARADLVTPMALRVAATLRLADHIAEGADTIPVLAERVRADPDALGRMVRYLASIGVFTHGPGNSYGLGPLGQMLLSGDSVRPRDWLDIEGAVGGADLALLRLLDTVRTGQAGYPLVYGRGFWEKLGEDPALSSSFDALMDAHLHSHVAELVSAYDWGSAAHVVDVGGGDGTLLGAILSEHPRLRGTLVELAGPASAARTKLAAQGLSDRCDVVTSSFFDPLPVGGDLYVLSSVLHDWSDEDATSILRCCAKAAGDKGVVLVIEALIEETSDPLLISMDIRMLAYTSGKERTAAEFEALARRAGLSVAGTRPASYRTLMELKPSV